MIRLWSRLRQLIAFREAPYSVRLQTMAQWARDPAPRVIFPTADGRERLIARVLKSTIRRVA